METRSFRVKTTATLMAILFLASIAVLMFPVSADPSTLYVDDDGVCGGNLPCYTTISGAVGAAGTGDNILVYPGTYNEQVDVDLPKTGLTITGLSWPVVIGNPKTFDITADDTTVEGFEVHQTPTAFGIGNDVIIVYDADHVTIRNNRVVGVGPYITWQDKNPGPGITVLISDDATIEGNNIHGTTGAGIWFGSSTNSAIKDNLIVNT